MGIVKGIVIIGLTLLFSPLIKGVFDVFINPTDGILVDMGVPVSQLAWIGTIPWLIPFVVIIWVIYQWVKPKQDKYGGYR